MKKCYTFLGAVVLFAFAPLARAQYCVPTYSLGCSSGDNIDDFTIFSSGLNHLGTGCSTGAYGDYTADPSLVASMSASVTYNFSATHGFSGQYLKIWIDFDDNMTFDLSDLVFASTAGAAVTTGTITIPISAPLGDHRMRVQGHWNSASADPCAPGGFGETHDYKVTILPPPTCPAPTSLTLNSALPNSAEVQWTEIGSATTWNIEWGTPGFSPGTGTEIGSTSTIANPETIGGLLAQTTYDVYIQADCGSGDQSTWSGPLSITTACDIYIAPFLEDFNAGTQPVCWDNTSSNITANGLWKFGSGVGYGASFNGQPAGTYAWSDGSTPEVPDITLTTPLIDVSALTVPQLKFRWFSNNTDAPGDNVPLEVQMNDGLGWQSLGTYSGDDDQWQEVELVLYTLASDTVQFRFITDQTVPIGSAFYNDILLDDVEVSEAPSCPRPSDIDFDLVTATSAEISWTSQGFEMEWSLEYGPEGFTPGTGTMVQTTTNPFDLNPLADNTTYDVYVRAVCSAGDTSTYRGTANFRTLCLPFTAQAYCEDFSSTSSGEPCWTVLNANADADSWDLNYTTNPYAGDQCASILTNFNGGNDDDYLITPQLTLTGNEVMSFFYRVQSATDMNDFEVLLSTTGMSPADFQDTLMYLNSYGNITYEDTLLNLSAYTGDVFIAFHIPPGGLDGNRLYIDQFCIDICTPTPSIDGTVDVCRLDDTLDLNAVIVPGENNGVWTFDQNPGVLNGSILNVSAMPDASYSILYVVTTMCTADTAYANVNIYGASSAGENGILEACSNQPIDLLGGLSGNVDLGGTWSDPQGNTLTSGYITTGNLAGQYNYSYVTSNGICPNDTSNVILNILPCDWLGLEDLALQGVTIYPNPTSGDFYISNEEANQSFSYEVIDLKGRKIIPATQVSGSAPVKVDLNQVENGIYLVRIFTNGGEKITRITKY